MILYFSLENIETADLRIECAGVDTCVCWMHVCVHMFMNSHCVFVFVCVGALVQFRKREPGPAASN